MATQEAPRFRVNEKSFIGHTLVEAGVETFYDPGKDGSVSANLSPVNDAAQALVDAQREDHPDKSAKASFPNPVAADASEELAAAQTRIAELEKQLAKAEKAPKAAKGKDAAHAAPAPAKDGKEGDRQDDNKPADDAQV
ncbi:hypothetical protein JessAGP_045c [Caulobacter phage Jess A]|nr:hypothetical protein JessAGP_045c [Caulobacter phage Jess A]WCA46454.1 hypothetical protein [Caulobacter phage RapA]